MANYSGSGDPYEPGPDPDTTPFGYYDGNQVPAGVDMVNGYGLYDVAGNAYEWCNDWYSSTYYSSSPYDKPIGPANGTYRVLRGGSSTYDTYYLRCADRDITAPDGRIYIIGFRLALNAEDCNRNGIPDQCDLDCQATDAVTGDPCSAYDDCGGSADENGNGVLDDCSPDIPAVSEWGVVAMTLLVLTAGTVVLVRRGTVTAR
jgi:hypothetical protein